MMTLMGSRASDDGEGEDESCERSMWNRERIREKKEEKANSCNARESKSPNVSVVVCESDTRLRVACDRNS